MEEKNEASKGSAKIIFFCLKILLILLVLFIFGKVWKDEAKHEILKTDMIFPGPDTSYMKYLSVDKGAVIGGMSKEDQDQKAKIFSISKAEYLALTDREWKLFQNNLKYIYYRRYSYVSLIFEDGSGIKFVKGKKASYGQMDGNGIITSGAVEVNPRRLEEDNGSNK